MGTLGVHQNIPASDTKLTHSLGIYSIGPPLVMDKLFPVISRAITSPPEMGPLLDVECKPAVIIKPSRHQLQSSSTVTEQLRLFSVVTEQLWLFSVVTEQLRLFGIVTKQLWLFSVVTEQLWLFSVVTE